MLRSDAALPFKDIVRNYDTFTQSVILSLVHFNKKFNPDEAPEGDYDVIARGATSLIAKEVRGMQIDGLSVSLTDDERDHVDERRFIEAKFASRDLQGMLVSADDAKQRKQVRAQVAAEQKAQQDKMFDATLRETASQSFKNIAQAQKNTAGAEQTSVKTAVELLSDGEDDGKGKGNGAGKAAKGSR